MEISSLLNNINLQDSYILHSQSAARTNRPQANMPTHLQPQSSLLTKLPRELLDLIYVELWRSHGLRQHILWHGKWRNKHFCHWPCTSEFDMKDKSQSDIEQLRSQLGVALGHDIKHTNHALARPYCRRLQSPWMNHWSCGERAAATYGVDSIRGFSTGMCTCPQVDKHQKSGSSWSPYLPLLLSCKLM